MLMLASARERNFIWSSSMKFDMACGFSCVDEVNCSKWSE